MLKPIAALWCIASDCVRPICLQCLHLCREVVLADSSAVCAARINASLASVHISSNGLLLAVCEAARIRTWAIADLLRGKQDALLSDWKLGNEETVKQACH